MIIITRGKRPVVISTNSKYGMGTNLFPVTPISDELLVDTNGAGDSFVGGFLTQQMSKNPHVAHSVECGSYCSRIVLQQVGCQFPKDFDYSDERMKSILEMD